MLCNWVNYITTLTYFLYDHAYLIIIASMKEILPNWERSFLIPNRVNRLLVLLVCWIQIWNILKRHNSIQHTLKRTFQVITCIIVIIIIIIIIIVKAIYLTNRPQFSMVYTLRRCLHDTGATFAWSKFTPVPSQGSTFVYMIPPCWRESPQRELTPVVVPGREFHSGTKSCNGIM